MNKNILSFIIPLIILSVAAFTPIFDKAFSDFKFKVNNYQAYTAKLIANIKNAEYLNDDFIAYKKDYSKEIDKVIKDKQAKIHAKNYLTYLNKMGVELLSLKKNNNDYKTMIFSILRFEYKLQKELSEIEKIEGKKLGYVLDDIYIDRDRRNKSIILTVFRIIDAQINKFDPKDYMGSDINYTASKVEIR